MSIEVPPSLLQGADTETVIDACYFVVRVLRNATRGYPNPLVSTEPSPEAHDLAKRAIREIEAREGMPVRDLSADRIVEYIASLEELLRTTYERAVGLDTARAASILAEMRSSGLTDRG